MDMKKQMEKKDEQIQTLKREAASVNAVRKEFATLRSEAE